MNEIIIAKIKMIKIIMKKLTMVKLEMVKLFATHCTTLQPVSYKPI